MQMDQKEIIEVPITHNYNMSHKWQVRRHNIIMCYGPHSVQWQFIPRTKHTITHANGSEMLSYTKKKVHKITQANNSLSKPLRIHRDPDKMNN